MAKNTYKQDEVLEEPFDIKHLLRASSYIKKYAKRMVFAILLSGIGGASGYVAPMIIQRALDLAIPEKNERLLFSLVGMLVGIYLVSVIFTTIRSRIMVDVSQSIIYDIRKDLFAHLQELPFQYYDDRPHGKILIRVVNYVNSVSDMLSNGLINIVLESFNLLFIVIFMFLVDVQMAFVVLCGVPVLCVFMVWIKNKQRRAWQAVSNKNSNLNAYLQENIVGARITQIFAREDENAEIFKDLSKDCRRTWNTAVRYSNLVWPGIDSISVCVRAAIFLSGLILFGQGNKSVGTIVAISSYASYFWQPIMNLGNIFNNFINNIAYLERIFETIDEPVAVKDAPDDVQMQQIKGDVAFDHVTFSYEDGIPILHDVSFKVQQGETIAIVGPTGAGKTTIVNLLSRFYNVDRGTVKIDGIDISKVTLRSLREQMGVMMQDSFIFSGTIMDNIRYGNKKASDEDVIRAAKTVCAHDFIVQMEDGYNTQVNERGSRLSVGQRQLISFARALLADPAILILDEATSSIDTETEIVLQEGLSHLLEGRTSFIIAHRLSTIKNANRIMYVADGKILESGSHEELLQMHGKYYELFMSQYKA